MRIGLFGFAWNADLQDVKRRHAIQVERRLSIARAVLAVVSLATMLWEHPRGLTPIGLTSLVAFTLYSLVQVLIVRRLPQHPDPPVVLLHFADIGWAVGIVSANGGIDSPFYAYYIFTLLASSYRWGLVETVVTGGVAAVATAADVALRSLFLAGFEVDVHDTSIRLAYVVVGAALMGYLAEDERRHRNETWAVSQILSRMQVRSGLVASVQGVLDALLRQLHARRAVLVLGEEGGTQLFVWEAEAERGKRTSIRLRQDVRDSCPWHFDVPASVGAFRVRRAREGTRGMEAAALDAYGGRSGERVDATPLLATSFEWSEAYCVPSLTLEDWGGRLFVFDPRVSRSRDRQLRFLQVVVRQVAPAVFNLYLQRRLQSRTGSFDRAQVSRQLHDGVIQSLIGIDMQLEVLKREAAVVSPAETASQLGALQGVLGEEILNLRDLMQVLKPSKVEPDQLVEHLTEEAAHFRNRTNIDARFSCSTDEIDLSPRVCHELAAIVQEGLANVRKHSGASSVIVRLEREQGDWLLTIDDNGRGFRFDGKLDHAQLDAQHVGPLLIKERVRSIGGTLSVQSSPGGGARLDIRIPGRHHAR